MKKKYVPHIIAVMSFVSFVVLGLACASTSDSVSDSVKLAPSVDEVDGLRNKLDWLEYNAESGGNYVLEVKNNEAFSFAAIGNLSYKDKSGISITIKGYGENRTITNYSNLYGPEPGRIFNVGSGVTLILDENITLKGNKTEKLSDAIFSRAVVVVSSGGTLVMNDGSIITGGVNCYNDGGGVHVDGGGTFLMKGGIITGNKCYPVASAIALAASGGKVTNLTDPGTYKGGGVYVAGRGTFTKTGGTIYGYTPNDSQSNICEGFMAQGVVSGNGHAIYAGGKRKEITAGPYVDLHFSDGVSSGNWDF